MSADRVCGMLIIRGSTRTGPADQCRRAASCKANRSQREGLTSPSARIAWTELPCGINPENATWVAILSPPMSHSIGISHLRNCCPSSSGVLRTKFRRPPTNRNASLFLPPFFCNTEWPLRPQSRPSEATG